MDDADLVRRISVLADEERRLEASIDGPDDAAADAARLREIEVSLDQCWDLLRQRRARRTAGADPDDAAVRPPSTVEGYRQ